MKKSLIVLSVLALVGCTKDWECTMSGTYEGTGTDLDGKTITATTHFEGTTDEKNDHEDAGTGVDNLATGGTFTRTTICVPE